MLRGSADPPLPNYTIQTRSLSGIAPSKQESTTYEPSPVCKLLILGCRLLIPDRLLDAADRLIGDLLQKCDGQAYESMQSHCLSAPSNAVLLNNLVPSENHGFPGS